MALSDEQLMLLEQMAYLDPETLKAMGLADHPLDKLGADQTLGDYLKEFTPKNIKNMEKSDYSDYPTAEEWENIINAIKSDPDLCELKLAESDSINRNYCFVDPDVPDKGIVVLRGTWGGREWNDDVEGLNRADTECQKETAEYINGLPYDDITVVGHSKGGNEAQYVTIVCDKVTRCVSMDGQGFSQEFLDRYAPEIAARGGLIRNYSLDTDYVHILMYAVPGAEQIFIRSNASDRGMQAHDPARMFDFSLSGDQSILKAVADAEDPALTYLRELTYFVLNYGTEEDQRAIVELAGPLLALLLTDDGFTVDGKHYDSGLVGALAFVKDHSSELTVLLDYVAMYIQVTGMTQEDLEGILAAFGAELPDGVADWLYTFLTENLQNYGVGYRIFDFSDSMKTLLLSTVASIGDLTGGVVSNWASYSGEDWYDELLISTFCRGINSYFAKIKKINTETATQAETIFAAARAEEAACVMALNETTEMISKMKSSIMEIASTLG